MDEPAQQLVDNAEPALEGLLTTADVARRFRVTTYTVRAWARSGRLPSVRLSDRWLRFRAEDVEQALENGVPRVAS